MFSIWGRPFRHCDGVTRRQFLTAGTMAAGGLTLAQLLRAEAQAGIGGSRKAVINIHLDGGPPQQDMIDLKPDAPAEIRGAFKPIATKIPGLHVCELLPRIASVADKWVLVRSLVGAAGQHDAFQCQSGFDQQDLRALGGRPAMGCVIAKLSGSAADPAPAFVDLMLGRPLVRNSARPGFLGPSCQPFRPDISGIFPRELEAGMKNELASQGRNHTTSLQLNAGLDAQRLDQRARLLSDFDRIRRDVDASGMMDAMDRFAQQAASILLSGRFAEALDLSRASSSELARYTPPAAGPAPHYTAEGPLAARKLLLARRLVESGVRVVSVSFSDFDTHAKNFPRMKHLLPTVDFALEALVSDLHDRGMLDDVSIVVWGEFGRTPKINSSGGRDHWPQVSMAMLAGGGIRGGQALGSTDRTASSVVSRPVQFQDIFATLYHNLGIDATRTTVIDTSGRPRYLVEQGQVLSELV